MRLLCLSLSFALFGSEALAQVTWFTNPLDSVNGGVGIGTPQVVPDPFTAGAVGDISLLGAFCTAPGPSLLFQVSGIPQGYTHGTITTETLVFALAIGEAATPGVTISGGTFFIPLAPPPTSFFLGAVTFSPTITCTGTGAGVVGATQLGGLLNLTSLIPPTPAGITLSMQAVLFDSALSNLFTSNAVNLQL